MGTILLLAGAGFVLLLTEMFLPGGLLGLLGILALCAAAVVGYAQFGPVVGSGLFAGIAVVTLVGFCIWMAVFPRTAVGKRLTLSRAPASSAVVPETAGLVGTEGIALTSLRPAGKALLAARRVDVVAEADFIEIHSPIVVVAREGFRVVVRKKA